MCAGDMTLEGAQTTKFHPKNMTGSDGWDAPHVCRDYGQIYTHLDRERAFDKHWIGQEPDTWEPE